MHGIWYAAYGTNMERDRLGCYLAGGCPRGASRTYVGARDRTLPTEMRPVELAGSVYFAWESPTWGGGIAFYDPVGEGRSVGRAYLLTPGQLADLHAQEMHREPGTDLDLTDLLADGSTVLGPGRYESLHVVGEIEDAPVVTFTSSWQAHEIPYNAPVAAYLSTMARGLAEGWGWTTDQTVDYLLERPGIGPTWDRGTLREALAR
ncbi:MAG: histone deacetylase [Nocardioides sp.]